MSNDTKHKTCALTIHNLWNKLYIFSWKFIMKCIHWYIHIFIVQQCNGGGGGGGVVCASRNIIPYRIFIFLKGVKNVTIYVLQRHASAHCAYFWYTYLYISYNNFEKEKKKKQYFVGIEQMFPAVHLFPFLRLLRRSTFKL